ncbi:MAG: hypothetical protein Q8P36_02380 [bacterium]|nr:hypothetical protein [bacterium]
MDALTGLLVFAQAFGALVGAIYAVHGELAYLRAARDGHIDKAERVHLDALARGLRFGMTLLLLASLGLVILAYASSTPIQPALTSGYWSFLALALLVTFLSFALSRGRISFSLGSAAVFTGWWFIVYLAFGRLPPLTLGASVALYVVATALFYVLLRFLRAFVLPSASWRNGEESKP